MCKSDQAGSGGVSQYRIFYQDGHVSHHDTSSTALKELRGLPNNCKVAIRGIGDSRPVMSEDYRDKECQE